MTMPTSSHDPSARPRSPPSRWRSVDQERSRPTQAIGGGVEPKPVAVEHIDPNSSGRSPNRGTRPRSMPLIRADHQEPDACPPDRSLGSITSEPTKMITTSSVTSTSMKPLLVAKGSAPTLSSATAGAPLSRVGNAARSASSTAKYEQEADTAYPADDHHRTSPRDPHQRRLTGFARACARSTAASRASVSPPTASPAALQLRRALRQ